MLLSIRHILGDFDKIIHSSRFPTSVLQIIFTHLNPSIALLYKSLANSDLNSDFGDLDWLSLSFSSLLNDIVEQDDVQGFIHSTPSNILLYLLFNLAKMDASSMACPSFLLSFFSESITVLISKYILFQFSDLERINLLSDTLSRGTLDKLVLLPL